jgi:tRNA dimethylallyltransferase
VAALKASNGPLVVIVGETASGKSAMALDLAARFDGEIICADSWTVYKGFDIGTAKPSPAERQAVPHHLLDIADPALGFSVVEFKKRAQAAIIDITNRGKLPILVGGSGLYIDAVLYDYQFLPAGQPGQRTALNELSLEELQAGVGRLKLDTAGIDTRNKRRLIRLIESDGQRPVKSKLRPRTIIIELKLPSDGLEKRITLRVDKMLEQGLEQEVKKLASRYGWDTEPMKGIGYREFGDYFDGNQSLAQTRQRIIQSSLRLAKKQRTWFKRNSSIHSVNDPSKSVEILTTFLNKSD